MKPCARCNTSKPDADFYPPPNGYWCKDCSRQYRRDQYAAMTPEQKAQLMLISAEKRRHRISARRAA